MRRLPFALLLLVLTPLAHGQAAAPPPITAVTPKTREEFSLLAPTLSTALTPAPIDPTLPPTNANAPTRPRALSAETAAKISANGPKFTPPPPTDLKEEERPDLREIDKPRNGIIRLPRVMVQEQKLPFLNDRELLTLSGKLDLAYNRHPGLHLGSLPPASNNRVALGMLAEELRLERMSEMSEIIGLYRYSDPKTGATLKAQAVPVFLRSSEWVEGGNGHDGGHALSKLQ